MRLSFYDYPGGVGPESGIRVVYDVGRGEVWSGAVGVDGHALVWRLGGDAEGAALSVDVDLDRSAEWLVRCDRVDFRPGGIAYLHTHPGPGIRYLLAGALEVHAAGRSTVYGPGEAWFESGPEPVLALASKDAETTLVRVLLLPREWEGKRTIRYLDLADDAKPKLQRATVFLEEPISL